MSSTREKILEAASVLIAKDGLKGTTTKEVAKRAGVNEVTIFRLFKSKQGLYQAILESLFPLQEQSAPLATLLAPPWRDREDLQTRLEEFGRIFHDRFLEKNRTLLEILIHSEKSAPGRDSFLLERASALADLLAARLSADPKRYRTETGIYLGALISCFLLRDPLGHSLVSPDEVCQKMARILVEKGDS